MPITLQVIRKIKFDANKATKKTDKEKRKKNGWRVLHEKFYWNNNELICKLWISIGRYNSCFRKLLKVKFLHCQGYDGAANASPKAVGVQEQITYLSGKAAYIQCCGQNLSIVFDITKKCPGYLRRFKFYHYF